jgi:hypothetical protein
MRVRHLGCGNDQLLEGFFGALGRQVDPAVTDIFENRRVEQDRLLSDQSNLASKPTKVESMNINAIENLTSRVLERSMGVGNEHQTHGFALPSARRIVPKD